MVAAEKIFPSALLSSAPCKNVQTTKTKEAGQDRDSFECVVCSVNKHGTRFYDD